MKGSIRIMTGFLVMFGAVGTMDYDPNSDLLVQTGLAMLGAVIAWWGVRAMNQEAV